MDQEELDDKDDTNLDDGPKKRPRSPNTSLNGGGEAKRSRVGLTPTSKVGGLYDKVLESPGRNFKFLNLFILIKFLNLLNFLTFPGEIR